MSADWSHRCCLYNRLGWANVQQPSPALALVRIPGDLGLRRFHSADLFSLANPGQPDQPAMPPTTVDRSIRLVAVLAPGSTAGLPSGDCGFVATASQRLCDGLFKAGRLYMETRKAGGSLSSPIRAKNSVARQLSSLGRLRVPTLLEQRRRWLSTG
jgi:hypothetical protein